MELFERLLLNDENVLFVYDPPDLKVGILHLPRTAFLLRAISTIRRSLYNRNITFSLRALLIRTKFYLIFIQFLREDLFFEAYL